MRCPKDRQECLTWTFIFLFLVLFVCFEPDGKKRAVSAMRTELDPKVVLTCPRGLLCFFFYCCSTKHQKYSDLKQDPFIRLQCHWVSAGFSVQGLTNWSQGAGQPGLLSGESISWLIQVTGQIQFHKIGEQRYSFPCCLSAKSCSQLSLACDPLHLQSQKWCVESFSYMDPLFPFCPLLLLLKEYNAPTLIMQDNLI